MWILGNSRRSLEPTALSQFQNSHGGSLIVNLPGNPKAVAECLDAVFPAIPYCIDLIDGPWPETNEGRLTAFRPKGK